MYKGFKYYLFLWNTIFFHRKVCQRGHFLNRNLTKSQWFIAQLVAHWTQDWEVLSLVRAQFMSPVSPVFFNSSSFLLYPGNKSRRDPIPDREFWSLSSTTTEDRLRHASGPVHISIPLYLYIWWIANISFIWSYVNFMSYGSVAW